LAHVFWLVRILKIFKKDKRMTFNLIPGQFREKEKSFMKTYVFKLLVIKDLLNKLASNYCEQYFVTTRRIRVKLKYGQQLYDM
jgi:hypothetical protein